MTEIPRTNQPEKSPKELSMRELALAIFAMGETFPEHAELLRESAAKLLQLQRLNELLGMLAPGGTAPRTGFEQLWIQSEDNSDESPILLELRNMLNEHWGDWTPAIREAEGLPPIQK